MSVGVNQTFGRLLKKLRTKQGLTQAELSDKSAVSSRSIRNLESGRALTPRKQTVLLLADALHLTGAPRAEFVAASHPYNTGRLAAAGVAASITSFPRHAEQIIGRDRTVRLAAGLLRSGHTRWVSLSGIVGVGKTRVAEAVAQSLQSGPHKSVVWVSDEEPKFSRQIGELLHHRPVSS